MRKKYISLAIIMCFIGIYFFTSDVKADHAILLHFNTNKESYYIDEDVIINATWDLYYEPALNEIAFVQVRLIHENGSLLWNSSEYHEIGEFQYNWSVSIFDLNITKDHKYYRKLTINECEKLQGIPKNYTYGVPKGERGKMLGNGFTVDVIAHILRGIKNDN